MQYLLQVLNEYARANNEDEVIPLWKLIQFIEQAEQDRIREEDYQEDLKNKNLDNIER